MADAELAERLRDSLESSGIQVWTAEDLDPGLPLEEEMDQKLRQSASAVVLVTGHHSSWQERDLKFAAKRGVPVTPVLVGTGETEHMMRELTQFQTIRLKDASEIGKAAEGIASRVHRKLRENT